MPPEPGSEATSRAIRADLRRRGIAATMPVPAGQARHRQRRAAAAVVHPHSTRPTTAAAAPWSAAPTASVPPGRGHPLRQVLRCYQATLKFIAINGVSPPTSNHGLADEMNRRQIP